MIPGWADTVQSWREFIRQLSKEYTVTSVDVPGFGGSEPPHNAWNVTDYAMFIKDFLVKTDTTPYAIVGHSNGGSIAIRLASQLGRVRPRLVLFASAGVRGEKDARRSALRFGTKVAKALSRPLPKAVRKRLRVQLYGSVGSDMLVAEHMQETFKRIVADDVRESARKLKNKTLLIYGEADTQTPVSHGEKLQECIGDSRLVVVPGAGHFVHLDQPESVLRFTKEFLK